MQPGEFTLVLDNYDLRYDPYNTGGALYGSIEPGKAVEFSVKYIPTGTTQRIFSGHIKDIRPTSGRNQVQIVVTDDLEWLAQQDITIPTSFNPKVSEAITATLNAANYPYAKSIEASLCPITFFDPQQANALDTIRQLADAGMGTVFVDRFGTLKYYDRTTTGQATTILDQAVVLKEITITQPWDTVRNKITCVANRFGYSPTEEIWRMDEPLGVADGATVSFKIEFDQARVQQPIRGTDYASDFTYENFVPYVGYQTINYFFSVWLSNITTTGATVNVSNIDTVYPYYRYLTFLVIRGNKLVNKKISFESIDATSAAKGPRRLHIDSPWLQDRGFAAAYAPLLLAHLKDPSKDPVITLETRSDGLGIDLLDRINLTSAKLGIDVTYDVGYISYKWLNETGQGFQQTFHMQNILYSTATITAQPFYPTLPPVPPVTPPPGVVIPPSTGTTGRAIDCTQSYPAISGATGPYSFGGGVIDNANPTTSVPIGKWFRSIYHPSRTYIEVDATWESLSSGVWTLDATFDFTRVQGISHLEAVVATGAISGDLVSNGIRRYNFNNESPRYIARLGFALAAVTGATYAAGNVVMTATAPGGVVFGLAGFTTGNLYSFENTGGPFYNKFGSPFTGLQMIKGPLYGDASVGVVGTGVGTPCGVVWALEGVYGEVLDASYARVYFRATQTTYYFRANEEEANFALVTGSMGVIIRNASQNSDKRITIRSINVYNVCDDDNTMSK